MLNPLSDDLPLATRSGDRKRWGMLPGASLSLLAARAVENQGLSLIITHDSASANKLEQELAFFLDPNDDIEILNFPDWETLPYDQFSPHQDITSQRLYTLYQLPQVSQGVLIVPITTLLHRLAPKDYLLANSLVLKQGQKFDIDQKRQDLERVGYRCVDTVYEHGEYAIRGALVDIFPMGSQAPYRIELFDDEIDTLRTFDTESQRSIQQVDSIHLLPAKEFPLNQSAIENFKHNWRESFDVDYRQCPVYMDITKGLCPAGIEYYLPLFFEHCDTLFDYLPSDCQIITLGDCQEPTETFLKEVGERYENHRHDQSRPILAPHKVFVTQDEFFANLKQSPCIQLHSEALPNAAANKNFEILATTEISAKLQKDQPFTELEAFRAKHARRSLFCCESAGRREQLLEQLARIDIRPREVKSWQAFLGADDECAICIAPLGEGFLLAEAELLVIPEAQLLGFKIKQGRNRNKAAEDNSDAIVRNLTELKIDDAVVHLDHGVGRYLGLQVIEAGGESSEFLCLQYANEAKLYVPVASLQLISRFSGANNDTAPLHRLGTEQWAKARRKAAEKARDAAAELLDIYARRAARKGFSFQKPGSSYLSFCQGFPFEETVDQQNAIDAVIKDMSSKKPMDRLVCGDVGFGKTEVAMRAAFMAVQSDKQVAMLVPTTLLAQQHYESFRDRFADWAVNVEVLSRFKTPKQLAETQKRIAAGEVDIVIGTHKLLQQDIQYKRLGLLMIDEEHRFGVRQKEKLKSLRSAVDIVTLTATPIPRTLNMAIAGMRDLSIIATPPAKRLSVKTFVRQNDTPLVKEAILRELLRGGQVYYLHNEVKDIEKRAREIEELVPEARVVVGHGQMRERELEQVMSDFYHKKFNVLVCTTIIETGIDVPNANTIIIDRADKFGLAQLHQLRGRVGRSHHQAYAYMLTPDIKSMTSDAKKRLEAISQADQLGAGFTLATHDMEIRGAGELLGDEQSGQIQTVGFSLYMEMLERAVESIQNGETPDLDKPLDQGSEINLRTPALIPDDYMGDVHTRLTFYKRIASSKDSNGLRELQVELIDRFGLLPQPLKSLFRISELKILAHSLGIKKVEANDSLGRIEFAAQTHIDPLVIVKLVQSQPHRYRLEGASTLKYQYDMQNIEQRFKQTETLLQQLAVSQ